MFAVLVFVVPLFGLQPPPPPTLSPPTTLHPPPHPLPKRYEPSESDVAWCVADRWSNILLAGGQGFVS